MLGGRFWGLVIKRSWRLWNGLSAKVKREEKSFKSFTTARRRKVAAGHDEDLGGRGIRKDHNESAGLGNNRDVVC